MHLFYTPDIEEPYYTLNAEESKHCVRVLRLVEGGEVSLVDGRGNYYRGIIDKAAVQGCRIRCIEKITGYGKRNFYIHIAIAPTKNIDRIEWMLEKCTEIGIDEITMLDTRHSERKTVKEERLEKILISAMKQSVKAYLPKLNPMAGFKQFISSCNEGQKFIAHCHDSDKKRLDEVYCPGSHAIILIGPEGDFSEEEIEMATQAGFQPITLGNSRLRTETAGMIACHSIHFINDAS